MKRLATLSLALALIVSQLTGRAQAGTTILGTIQVGGITRDYRLYVPLSYQATRPTPLLFNLHGYTSNAQEEEAYADFRAIADTAGFLIVHPNGTFDGYGNRYWNTFSVPGTGGADDVAFLSALLTALRQYYNIDPARVYSTGFSNGGFMSYELARCLSTRIAAVASVSGSIATTRIGACRPARPVPVMEIHGTADTTVPYGGSALFTSVPDVLSYWVQTNGCPPTPTVTAVPDFDSNDGSTVERSVWSGGLNGSVVEHYRILGGGHTWPGSAYTIGVTNRDISASREIWRFLRPQRLPAALLATAGPAAGAAPLRAYPNPAPGEVSVLLSGPATLRPEQLLAFDSLGRAVPVQASAAAGGAVQLNVGAWPAGVYVLRLAGQPGTLKLVR